MIPSTFMYLDSLPLLPNGKVDLQNLPEPGSPAPEPEEPFVGPRNGMEAKLARIWSQVLGLDRVGVFNNFLDLGGHSLLATQLMSRVRDTFQIELALRSFFEAPTVAHMAVAIVQNQAKETDQEDLNRMLAELEMRSDEQVQRLLTEEDDSSRVSDF